MTAHIRMVGRLDCFLNSVFHMFSRELFGVQSLVPLSWVMSVLVYVSPTYYFSEYSRPFSDACHEIRCVTVRLVFFVEDFLWECVVFFIVSKIIKILFVVFLKTILRQLFQKLKEWQLLLFSINIRHEKVYCHTRLHLGFSV